MTATVITAQPAVRRSHAGSRFVLLDPGQGQRWSLLAHIARCEPAALLLADRAAAARLAP